MPPQRLGEIARRFAGDLRRHDVTGVAAELAFRFLFALFPFVLFLAALGAFAAQVLGIENPAQQLVRALGDNLPPDLASTIRPELEQVIGETSVRLLSGGALAALWAATGGTNALIKAMNRALEVEETRPLLYRIGLAVALTILGGAGIMVSFVTVVGGALATEELARSLGLTGAAWTAVTLLRWPLVFVVLVVAVSVLYRLAPNARVSWRWIVAGASMFAVGWLIATWAFAWYIGSFGNYGATYGSLGAVIVLMLWFYLTGLLLVGAAELTTAIASVVEPESLRERREAIAAERAAREAEETAKRAATHAVDGARSAIGADDAADEPSAAGRGGDRRVTGTGQIPDLDRRIGEPDRRIALGREPRPN